MIEKDSKVNEVIRVGDITIKALETESKIPIAIGEIRESEQVNSIMKAMEHDNGHNVVSTMMCANPSEAVVRLIEKFKYNTAMREDSSKISVALTSKLNINGTK